MDIIQFIGDIDAFVWGPPMIVLLLGSHLFLTFRTGFIQRKLPTAIKLSVTKDPDAPGDISQFGALTTALSATIGTGNIVGVGTAILAGGPGAVLWMWLTGVFGMATKYSETFAAVKYRVKDHNGNMLGGAMYAWRRAFEKDGKAPWWGLLGAGAFALFAAVASFGIGSAVQSSAMTGIITSNAPGVPTWGIGLAIVIMVSLVIFGGIKIISKVCEKLVPFMAIAYAWGCIVIIGMNWEFVWPAICLIFECASQPHSSRTPASRAPARSTSSTLAALFASGYRRPSPSSRHTSPKPAKNACTGSGQTASEERAASVERTAFSRPGSSHPSACPP